MENYPQRKQNRLDCLDYSSCNAYFITVCTANRIPLFWSSNERLSALGHYAEKCLLSIPDIYPHAELLKYCVMPDHIHLILLLNDIPGTNADTSRIIGQFKRVISKHTGKSIWQKSFYDHVIRNHQDLLNCWQYIDNNPRKLALDKERNR